MTFHSTSPPARRIALGLVLASIAATPVAANGIRVADHPGLRAFTSLQAAIDAAPDGGLLLVQSGNYGAAVIDGKSLSIVEMPGAIARTSGTFTIKNLSSNQRVVVSGLEVRGTTLPGMMLENNAGHVRLQDCRITGGAMFADFGRPGASGIEALACPQVVLADCIVTGGDAQIDAGFPGLPGGIGLSSVDSNFVLYDCTVRGGQGGLEGSPMGGRSQSAP